MKKNYKDITINIIMISSYRLVHNVLSEVQFVFMNASLEYL